MRFWKAAAGTLILTIFCSHNANALLLWEDDANDLQAAYNAGKAAPDDLLKPESNRLIGESAGFGVIIADGWILASSHTFDAPFIEGKTAYVLGLDGRRDNSRTLKIIESFDGPSDLGLHRVEWSDEHVPNTIGPPADFLDEQITPLAQLEDLFVGKAITFTGKAAVKSINTANYGPGDAFPDSGDTFHYEHPIVSNRSEASWAKNRIETNETIEVRIGLSHPSEPDYLKYEAQAIGGDSGGGAFIRDGYEWKVISTFRSHTLFPVASFTDHINWIEDRMQEYGESLPTPVPATLPTANHNLTASSGAVSSTIEDVAWIESNYNLASIGSTNIEMQDIFVARNLSNPNTPDPTSLTVTHGSEDLSLKGGLFMSPTDGSNTTYTLTGGSIAAHDIYVGYEGNGQFNQIGGSVSVQDGITLGREDEAFGVYVMNAGSVDTYRIALGRKNGGYGIWTQANGDTTAFDTKVGFAGTGVLSMNGGTFTTSKLSIGDGEYGGSGQLLLSNGTLNAKSVSVAPGSTITVSGGNLLYEEMVIDGVLHVSGGILDGTAGNGLTLAGDIDFGNTAGTMTLSGEATLHNGQFLNVNGATIDYVNPEGLLIVNSAQKALTNTGGLTITTAGQGFHTIGETLTIDQHTVRTSVDLDDRVVINGTGKLFAMTDGTINLNSGINVSSTAEVNLGSNGVVNIVAGRDLTINDPIVSSISMDLNSNSNFKAAEINISTTGQLTLDGNIGLSDDTAIAISSQGKLNIGNGISELHVNYLYNNQGTPIGPVGSGNGGSPSLVLHSSSSTEFDFESQQADKVIAGYIDIAGEIILSVDLVDFNAMSVGVSHDLISALALSTLSPHNEIEGTFAKVTYNGIDLGDQLAEGKSIAITYDQDTLGKSSAVTAQVSLLGDVDLDGDVDESDWDVVLANLGSTDQSWNDGDLDGSGIVDDVDLWLASMLGDADFDGDVDGDDLIAVQTNFGNVWSTSLVGPLVGDADTDGDVDGDDLIAVQTNFGNTYSNPPPTASAVPEPSALVLCSMCLAMLAKRDRQR